jgi:hypothetical protein
MGEHRSGPVTDALGLLSLVVVSVVAASAVPAFVLGR